MDKERVRLWLAGRRGQRVPPPPIEQIRAELGWVGAQHDQIKAHCSTAPEASLESQERQQMAYAVKWQP